MRTRNFESSCLTRATVATGLSPAVASGVPARSASMVGRRVPAERRPVPIEPSAPKWQPRGEPGVRDPQKHRPESELSCFSHGSACSSNLDRRKSRTPNLALPQGVPHLGVSPPEIPRESASHGRTAAYWSRATLCNEKSVAASGRLELLWDSVLGTWNLELFI
jgi:hypothetical protein